MSLVVRRHKNMSQTRPLTLRLPPVNYRSILRTLPATEPWRQELDLDREERDARGGTQLIKEILRWLLLAQRPLTMSELRHFVQFSFTSDGLRLRPGAVEDLETFLVTHFPASVDIRMLPMSFAVPGPCGHVRWQTSLRQTAILRTDAIRAYLANLPVSHYLYMQPRDSHYRITEICLRYMAQVPGAQNLEEQATMQLCADQPLLKYILDHWCRHASLISSEALIHTLAASPMLKHERIVARAGRLLPYAARYGHLLLVQKLLTVAMIHPDTRELGERSHTALSLASCNNHKEVVKLILAHPLATLDLRVLGDYTALHLSIMFENFGIARLLLRRGASQTLSEEHGWAAANLLLRTTGARKVTHGLGCQQTAGAGPRSFESYQNELKYTVDVLLATKPYDSALILTAQDIDTADENGNSAFVEQMLLEHRGKLLIESPPKSPAGSEDGQRSPKSEAKSNVWYDDDDEEEEEDWNLKKPASFCTIKRKPACCIVM
ncbi:hypothetical protein BCR37DRAFT_252858 [Protomyces lactucae-debilis]|uniref:Uncharacterized protein n=1 Tax=Protomyces lactucae-debilis TaxID=2754530 RepID=A0A1Y2FLN8_PROLT|nr:uncharacterized protein BCR37DRAFT_252858 [Protomyces lactucae-debilis]ORY84868.1 hypothetical protein BCR37DRAFT_252858 [Protomyces lactucae-debilis]